MAVYTGEQFKNRDMPTSTNSGQLLAYRAKFVFPSAVTLALGDVIRLAQLPPNFSLVGIDVDHDALGTACVADVGILNAGETATVANAITGMATTAGLVVTNDMAARRFAINATTSQTVGLVVTTAASAALASGAVVGAIIYYRAKQSVE